MEPKISIIVPVYNVEQYLERCVESLMNQSYKNIEILLINDGSTDNSGKLCDEIAKRDSRITVQMLETTVLIKQLLISLDLWIVMTMLMKICMKSYSQIF